jgi:hypothetical protein
VARGEAEVQLYLIPDSVCPKLPATIYKLFFRKGTSGYSFFSEGSKLNNIRIVVRDIKILWKKFTQKLTHY